MRPVVTELRLDCPPDRLTRLGFAVADGRTRIGTVDVLVEDGTGAGLTGWSLAGVTSTDLDGVPTTVADLDEAGAPGPATGAAPAATHPNGARSIDHVVLQTPDLDRTLAALAAAGLDLRRTRDAGTPDRPVTQAFYRLGEVILEVVGSPEEHGEGPSSLWGFVCTVADLDAVVARWPELVEPPHDAVQPGRRIATATAAAGLSVPFAFMSE
jgi:hypothetical protein